MADFAGLGVNQNRLQTDSPLDRLQLLSGVARWHVILPRTVSWAAAAAMPGVRGGPANPLDRGLTIWRDHAVFPSCRSTVEIDRPRTGRRFVAPCPSSMAKAVVAMNQCRKNSCAWSDAVTRTLAQSQGLARAPFPESRRLP